MFPLAYRLPSQTIPLVLKKGIFVSLGVLQMKYVPSPLATSRFACIVSSKVERGAVGRNRSKRLLRHAAYKTAQSMKHSIDCVLIPRRPLSKMTIEEVQIQVDTLMKRIKVHEYAHYEHNKT